MERFQKEKYVAPYKIGDTYLSFNLCAYKFVYILIINLNALNSLLCRTIFFAVPDIIIILFLERKFGPVLLLASKYTGTQFLCCYCNSTLS